MQTTLFEDTVVSGLTIEQAAKTANVSTATIRNWIKSEYLTQYGKGVVDKDSLDNFMSTIAGIEKLNSRANKSQKDEHDHERATSDIAYLLKNFTGEKIGIAYENSLSESYRNKEGIYYTPSWIVKDMLEGIAIDAESKFLDPCCGSGNFIIEAIKKGVLPENVYGFDIDENAVHITKERIRKEFGFETPNIVVGDFLREGISLKKETISFDYIFTNPPWGKKIDKSEKERFAKIYGCGSSLDTTSLFFGASFSILKQQGVMGFLVQEAFFNITTFEDIRAKTLSKKVVRFVDYDKAFKGLLTKAQAVIVENASPNQGSKIECCFDNAFYSRSLDSFKANPKKIFNFWTTEDESKVIDRLYQIKHVTLQGNAKWALGLVTGNNEKYCIGAEREGYLPVYKGSDITKQGLKEPTTFILGDFSKYQQVAPLEMYQAKEKLIYKFISSNLCFYCDNQQRFILNSANLLIPTGLTISSNQLVELLNSELMNWLFKKLFSTHKVLRGDLELLPIHTGYFEHHKEFSEETYLKYLNITQLENGSYRLKG